MTSTSSSDLLLHQTRIRFPAFSEAKVNIAPIEKGDTAHAVCTPIHSGRTTIVLQTNITRGDGRLAAIVTQTQIVLPAQEPAAE